MKSIIINHVAIFLCIFLKDFVIIVKSNQVYYHNHEVFKISPKNVDNLKELRELDGTTEGVRFLDGIQPFGRDTYVIVAPNYRKYFIQKLDKMHLPHDVVEKNFQRALEINGGSPMSLGRSIENYNWQEYQTLETTYKWLKSLAEKYPGKIEILNAGKTYEGRDMLGVKLSHKANGNKGIFIEAGIHAREWISPAVATYILNQLLVNNEPSIREIAERFDWYIFPYFNPDGYVYTYTRDRLWRKTRSPQQGSCYGADPNRNWGYHWNEVGSSSSPCSETFAGRTAFSEVETRSLSKFIESLNGKIHTYISFHSYSQLLLFPYGHTKQHARNHNDLQHLGNVAITALKKRYGTKYIAGNVFEAIYPASGSSMDWAYGTQNISLSYTYELRPSRGYTGFILPKEQIIPTGEETFDSLIALIQEAQKFGYYQ